MTFLDQLRTEAAGFMAGVDGTGNTVKVTRPQNPADAVYDPVTATVTAAAATTIYEGPGSVGIEDLDAQADQPGGQHRWHDDYHARVPVTATGILVGDVLEVVASDDPDMVGAEFTVSVVVEGTFQATRRLGLQRIERGPRR